MTDFRGVVQVGMDEYLDGLLKALAGLSAKERRFQPTPEANHIDFTVWHLARNEDETFHLISGAEQLWVRDRWFERFGLGREDDGCGFTTEQVRSLPNFEIELCLSYLSNVRAAALPILAKLTNEDLDRSPIGLRDGITTTGRLLGHFLIEQGQHLGQVAYLRGLHRGVEHTTSWNNPETPMPLR